MMTHTYKIEGITCDGCVSTITDRLLKQPMISDVTVLKENQTVSISMLQHLSLTELQHALGHNATYKIKENRAHEFVAPAPPTQLSWLQTYQPLLTIASFITLVSVVTSQGNFLIGMNHFMAGFFLVFSLFKFFDLKGFASSYSMYDLLAKKITGYGFIYPFIELLLGLAYATNYQPHLTNWITLLLMSFSSLGVIQSVLSRKKIRCACLGGVFNLPMSTVTIIEDLLMVTMAALMLVFH